MGLHHTVIGVDVGGTKVAAALMRGRVPLADESSHVDTETPEILCQFTAPTDASSPEACLRDLEACIAKLWRNAGAVEAIGIGIASMVDFAAGRVVDSVNLPLTDVPLRDHFERRFGVPVVIDNDATAACIGEHTFGVGVGSREMLMLTLGTGVGGGIISGGRPLRGTSGAAGEIGHLIIDLNGPKCPANCPNYGCLEAYVSGSAMGAAACAAAARDPDSALGRALTAGGDVDSRLLASLAAGGDAAAIAVLERVGEYLGAGLVSLSNIFDPELIVIGGGAAAAGELLLAPARRFLAARALPPARDRVRVVPAALGPEAGFIGAAALALTELFLEDERA